MESYFGSLEVGWVGILGGTELVGHGNIGTEEELEVRLPRYSSPGPDIYDTFSLEYETSYFEEQIPWWAFYDLFSGNPVRRCTMVS